MLGEFDFNRQPTLADVRRALEQMQHLPDSTPVAAARYRPPGVYKLPNEAFVTFALPEHYVLCLDTVTTLEADHAA